MANIRPKTLSFNKEGDTYTLRGITTAEETKIANAITEHQDISGKVDKVEGKGLSTNDYTDAEKTKLSGIAEGATANTGTITGITMNGASKGTSGVVDLGTVITEHQDISGKMNSSLKGAANGVAELDATGKVPSSQLPSYVDDVIEGYYYDGKFYEESTHQTEITGETGKVYVDISTNLTYRWSGSAYVPIASDLALGETSSTAYRGDRGAAAYAAAVTNVDTTPTEGSTHLITSGGVKAAIPDISGKADKTDTVLNTTLSRGRKANTTVGYCSFAFGNNVEASHNYSYAEGSNTKASGQQSHAAGNQTTASGLNSHTEGYGSTASGEDSHAEGVYTTASKKSQHVFGEYNVAETGATNEHGSYVEIVGNGTGTTSSNARTLDWNGNEYLKGDLYVGCNANSTGGTKVTPLPVVTSSDNGKSLEVSNGSWATGSKKIDKEYDTNDWLAKTWTGLTEFNGEYVWTDGENIYYSYGTTKYVLDKLTSTWSVKSWTGLTSIYGNYIWTDGDNIYYSTGLSQYVLDKSTSTWSTKSWTGLTNFNGSRIWTDGENIYYSYNLDQYILNKSTSTWSTKSWTGLTTINGQHIWTDGDNIYYSNGSNQYVLNKTMSTWSAKTWTGLTNFNGNNIWTDGENIYYSNGSTQYVLNKSTSTWSAKTWTGLTSLYGSYTWTDGENIYHSDSNNQYKFNKQGDKILIGRNGEFTATPISEFSIPGTLPDVTSADNGKILKVVSGDWEAAEAPSGLPDVTSADNGKSLEVSNGAWATGTKKIDKEYELQDGWETKSWTGLTNFYGNNTWTDGDNIYYSNGSNQYVLNKTTSTWSAKTWTGLTSFAGSYTWTDGDNIYFSDNSNQYVLDKSTSTWSTKSWTGLTSFAGNYIWTDGNNIYYSDGSSQYVLNKSTSTWSEKTWTGLTSFAGNYVWTDGENIYYSNGSNQYSLNKSTSAWSAKTWTGSTVNIDGRRIWTDGDNIYYSNDSTQYVLNKSTSTWSTKTWSGLTNFNGLYVWTDGKNTYYSDGSTQYKFNKPEDQILIGRNGEFTSMSISDFATLLMGYLSL